MKADDATGGNSRLLKFLKRLIGYGLLFNVVAQMASCAPTYWRKAIAGMSSEPALGNPPYRSHRPFTTADYAALRRFPDLASCLDTTVTPALWDETLERVLLRKFSWRKIATDEEAQVCLFRIFSHIGGRAESKIWIEPQGLHVVIISSPAGAQPIEKSLSASWSISARGPLFQQALFGHPWHSMPVPYALTINAKWDRTENTVEWVHISYSTL